MAADTTLADVVQHVADGAAQQGYITEAERQEMLDAAARGERPDVDLSTAPPAMQAGVEQVLVRAEALAQAEARLSDEREMLHDKQRDEQEQVGELREAAMGLRDELDEASVEINLAEQDVAHADASLRDAENLIVSATSDADWQTARELSPGLVQDAQGSLSDAVDRIEVLHETLPSINDRLDTALADVTVLSDERDATDDKLARNSAESRDVAAGWTVLEAQADHVFAAQADGAGAHEQEGAYASTEPHHGGGVLDTSPVEDHGAMQAGDGMAHAAETSAAEATE